MNALDLIRVVPEIEKRLADELSRQIYKIRMEYAIYRNKNKLISAIKAMIPDWDYRPELDEFLNRTKPTNIVIFGSGVWGQHNFVLLKNSKYRNLNIIFCDNDNRKWNTESERGGGNNKS